MKCRFDTLEGKFVCKNPQADAMLIKNERVESICAFAPDGLILSASPADLLVVRDYKVIHYVSDPDRGNIVKHWQAILPFFDIDECPFILSSGSASYNLVNVKSG